MSDIAQALADGRVTATALTKTYLARMLAEFMFGDSDALIQIDMS